tara:strand:- start:142 stop:261 length:120 start_codon:yes stop_codon:yes gene_type:complete
MVVADQAEDPPGVFLRVWAINRQMLGPEIVGLKQEKKRQ